MANKQNFFRRNGLMIVVAIFASGAAFAAVLTLTQPRKTVCPVSACVALKGKVVEPQTITVTNGSYVQFNSADGQKHNIALSHSAAQHDDPSKYESGDFQADEAWKVQFKSDGAYTFRDKYNEGTEFSVVVYTPGSDYKVK